MLFLGAEGAGLLFRIVDPIAGYKASRVPIFAENFMTLAVGEQVYFSTPARIARGKTSIVTGTLEVTGMAYISGKSYPWLFGGVKDGAKWLADYDGTTVRDLSTNVAEIPRCIIGIAGGNFWIGCENAKLYEYDGTTFTDRSTAVGFPTGEAIRAMAWDGARLWLGGGGGTFKRYNPATGEVVDLTTSLGMSRIDLLLYNPVNGQVVIVGVKAGAVKVYSYDMITATFTDRTTAVGITTVTALTMDGEGRMYFGGSAGEVHCVALDWTSYVDITGKFGTTTRIISMLVTDRKELADDWLTMTSMPTVRQLHPMGVVNDIIYVAGGENAGGRLATHEAYDPSTDSWSSKTALPATRSTPAGIGLGGLLYVLGGINGGAWQSTVYAYDPSTDSWSSKASMPTARGYFGVATVGGLIYAIGGYNGARLTANEAYDPNTNTWTSKASMPTGRSNVGVGVVGNIIYVIGGYATARTNVNEAYDTVNNSWSSKAVLPVSGELTNCRAVIGNIIYMIGAYTGSNTNYNHAYDPNTDTWSSKAGMPTARRNHATEVVNNIIYVVGGYTTDYVAINEAYFP